MEIDHVTIYSNRCDIFASHGNAFAGNGAGREEATTVKY